MRNIRAAAATLLVTLFLFVAGSASAAQPDKVTICHATGLAGTEHFVTLTLAYPAVYGEAGHFYENGTPRAGHEEDYLGPCDPTPTPSIEPSPSPSASPSESPSPSPTVEPSPSVSPAPSATPVSKLPSPPPTDTASVAVGADASGALTFIVLAFLVMLTHANYRRGRRR